MVVNMQRFKITKEGYQKIKDELNNLVTVERPAVSKAIGAAIELGDLSENEEYASAKEKQKVIEAMIVDLSDRLANAEVVDLSNVKKDTIDFGAKVKLIDLNNKGVRVEKTDKKIRFCIENKKNVIQIPNSIKEEAIKNRKEKINKFIMDLDYQIMNLRYINCLQKNSVPLIYSYLWLYKDLVNQQIYRNETYRAYLDN